MSIYSTATLTMLGGREEQQDAYCLERRWGEIFAAVCDGIGGLPRGEEASYLAAKTLLDEERPWTEQDEQNYETILLQMLKKINDNITSWR